MTKYPRFNKKTLILTFLIAIFVVTTFNVVSACQSCDDVSNEYSSEMIISMKNPAAVYCTELGYEYKTVQTEQGKRGVCVFPNDDECDAWSFLEGKDGEEYSYCALNGSGVETRRDGKNPFSCDYAVCVPKQQSKSDSIIVSSIESMSVTDLMNLDEKVYADVMPITHPENEVPISLSVANEFTVGTPSSFDWRNHNGKNWVTPVKDQNSCGSCWAFAAVAGVEAKYNIALNDPNYDVDLSEQYLVSDCLPGYFNYYDGFIPNNCSGGNPLKALDYIRDYGIADEWCYPYTASNSNCSDRCPNWQDQLWTIDNYGYPYYVYEIKPYLIEKGPLTAFIGMNGGFHDGIYKCGGSYSIGHAVLLVGYNNTDNIEEGYWIAKNSWGTGWPNTPNDGGYFKVGYGECGITQYAPLYIDLTIDCAPDPFPMPTPDSLPAPYQRPDPIPIPVSLQIPAPIPFPIFY